MQPRIAKHVLADLARRGWIGGRVVYQRPGVCAIDITTPAGERCEFTTVDDVHLKLRILQAEEKD